MQHLPDPRTATPQVLESQADILRARRFPQDAIDFYTFALTRGGAPANLLNKLGMTELDRHNLVLAEAYFLRATHADGQCAEAWNNLGATQYVSGRLADAIGDYKRAAQLEQTSAVIHSNLMTAYFRQSDYAGARREIALAMKLDPAVFDRLGAGLAPHILSTENQARLSFEMARVFAQSGEVDEMMTALTRANEAGPFLRAAMHKDAVLARFADSPRVLALTNGSDAAQIDVVAAGSAAGDSASATIPAGSD